MKHPTISHGVVSPLRQQEITRHIQTIVVFLFVFGWRAVTLTNMKFIYRKYLHDEFLHRYEKKKQKAFLEEVICFEIENLFVIFNYRLIKLSRLFIFTHSNIYIQIFIVSKI